MCARCVSKLFDLAGRSMASRQLCASHCHAACCHGNASQLTVTAYDMLGLVALTHVDSVSHMIHCPLPTTATVDSSHLTLVVNLFHQPMSTASIVSSCKRVGYNIFIFRQHCVVVAAAFSINECADIL